MRVHVRAETKPSLFGPLSIIWSEAHSPDAVYYQKMGKLICKEYRAIVSNYALVESSSCILVPKPDLVAARLFCLIQGKIGVAHEPSNRV